MPPEISVVVPSFNRCEPLGRLLDGLAAQDLAADRFEVIVVLDGASDDSAAMLRGRTTPFALSVIEQVNAGPGAARNRGVAEASGTYCVFLDDDMTVVPGILREHLAAQERARGAVVMGRIVCLFARRGFEAHTMPFWRRYEAARQAGQPLTYLDAYSGNMSVPTTAFRSAGGFDVRLRRLEDMEIALRLEAAGTPLAYSAEAQATQHYNKTTAQILRDQFETGLVMIPLTNQYAAGMLRLRFWLLSGRDPLSAEVARRVLRLPVSLRVIALGRFVPEWAPGAQLVYSAMRAFAMHKGVIASMPDRKEWDAASTGVRILRYPAAMPRDEVRRQVSWLRAAGVSLIGLEELVRRLATGKTSPRFTAAIAVDDGTAVASTIGAELDAMGVPWNRLCDAAADGVGEREEPRGGCFPADRATSLDAARQRGLEGARHVGAVCGRTGVVGMATSQWELPTLTVTPGLKLREFRRLFRYGRAFRRLPI